MGGNVLQAIGLTPDWFQSVMGGVANGTDQPDASAQAPQPQAAPQGGLSPEWFSQTMGADMPAAAQPAPQPQGQPANLLEGLGYDQPGAAAPAPQQTPAPAAPPRSRRSLLDTVGRISDVLAKVGGADALYQPTLDAREDRQLALGDHARGVDLDALKMAVTRQQLLGGQAEIDDHSRAVLGQAMRGLQAIQAGGGDVNKAWPILAQRMGIPAEQAAEIGKQIAADPSSVSGLFNALNDPKQQGTQPKEIQIYNMLAARDPKMAAAYLQSVADPNSITPKQRADLAIAQAHLGIDTQELDLKRADTASQIAARDAKTAAGPGSDLTPTQRGAIVQKMKILPSVVQSLNRVDQLSKELSAGGTSARGYLGGMVPGALVGGKADEFDKAVGLLRQQIIALTRTPGIGSMSDYETRLLGEAIPSRQSSDAGRAETLSNLRALVTNLAQGYREMVPDRPAARRPSGGGGGGALPPRLNAPAAPRRQTAPPGYGSRTTRPTSGGGWGKATVVK